MHLFLDTNILLDIIEARPATSLSSAGLVPA